MFYIRTSAAASLLLGLAFQGAQADQVAATVTTVGGEGGTVWSTQGWEFTPAVNLLVTRLGVFDGDAFTDGLAESHDVAIWTADGTLVVSATVPAGTAAALEGGTRFVAVADTPLIAGQPYVIGAYYQSSTDGLIVDGLNSTVLAYNPMVVPGAGRGEINQFLGIGFPTIVLGSGSRLGPNFAFSLPAPVTHTWPTDPAPCNDINDLTACLNGANHGDTIEIAANAIPGQDIGMDTGKSFTLRPAAGFTPVFGDYTRITQPGGDVDATVVIEGLTVVRGAIAVLGGSGLLDVTLRNNVIQQLGNTAGMEVAYRPGRTIVKVENNQINANLGPLDFAQAITVWGLEGNGNVGRIAANRINQVGGGQNGAIDIFNNLGTLEMDVIGNQISGIDFAYGIGVNAQGDGSMTGRIVNNVVSGLTAEDRKPVAITIYISGGNGDFSILNNTVAYNEYGIQFGGRADLGATGSALIANNIVAFNTEAGMNLDPNFAPTTTINEFNLVHGNGSDDYTPGPGTLTNDPLFLDPGDLRFIGGSPAENSGSSSRVPADITTDVDGFARIQGIVDRGAYEVAAGGSDVDADGIADGLDNCTQVANSDQRDSNGDDYGNVCDADLNNNGGVVNLTDFALFRGAFGTANAHADIDGNGIVNLADFARFRALFGLVVGPSGLHP